MPRAAKPSQLGITPEQLGYSTGTPGSGLAARTKRGRKRTAFNATSAAKAKPAPKMRGFKVT